MSWGNGFAGRYSQTSEPLFPKIDWQLMWWKMGPYCGWVHGCSSDLVPKINLVASASFKLKALQFSLPRSQSSSLRFTTDTRNDPKIKLHEFFSPIFTWQFLSKKNSQQAFGSRMGSTSGNRKVMWNISFTRVMCLDLYVCWSCRLVLLFILFVKAMIKLSQHL